MIDEPLDRAFARRPAAELDRHRSRPAPRGAAGDVGDVDPDRDLRRLLHQPHARRAPRAWHLGLRLRAVRPGRLADVAVRGAVRDADGPQPDGRPQLVHPRRCWYPSTGSRPAPGSCSSASRCDARRGALPGVPLRPHAGSSPTGLALVFGRGVPAASGRRVDEPARTSIPTRSSGCSSASPSTPRSSASGGLYDRVRRAGVAREGGRGRSSWSRSDSGWRSSATSAIGLLTIAAGVWAAMFAMFVVMRIADRRADPERLAHPVRRRARPDRDDAAQPHRVADHLRSDGRPGTCGR